jgi:hypothetical protein
MLKAGAARGRLLAFQKTAKGQGCEDNEKDTTPATLIITLRFPSHLGARAVPPSRRWRGRDCAGVSDESAPPESSTPVSA